MAMETPWIPDFIKRQLGKDEKVLGFWHLTGLSVKRYLLATDRRGMIYVKGALTEELRDFLWSLTSSVQGMRTHPLSWLGIGLAAFVLPILILFTGGYYAWDIALIAGFLLSLTAVSVVADYAYKRGGALPAALAALVMLSLAVLALVLAIPSGSHIPAHYVGRGTPPTAVLSIIYGLIAIALFLAGIDVMAFYVVGLPRPLILPKLIPEAIAVARAAIAGELSGLPEASSPIGYEGGRHGWQSALTASYHDHDVHIDLHHLPHSFKDPLEANTPTS